MFGLEPLTVNERKDLLEVLEDWCGTASTVITSQLDPKQWHALIGDATVADAILDRVLHNAHRIKLMGESIRKQHGKLTTEPKPEKRRAPASLRSHERLGPEQVSGLARNR
ncbi:ATP-binding protein [Archangium lipolyticum]|uniref:ATP-binding protein n=1 Tax=Archangium lipolyticum TaxID=2970465 RepID=UPI00389967CE